MARTKRAKRRLNAARWFANRLRHHLAQWHATGHKQGDIGVVSLAESVDDDGMLPRQLQGLSSEDYWTAYAAQAAEAGVEAAASGDVDALVTRTRQLTIAETQLQNRAERSRGIRESRSLSGETPARFLIWRRGRELTGKPWDPDAGRLRKRALTPTAAFRQMASDPMFQKELKTCLGAGQEGNAARSARIRRGLKWSRIRDYYREFDALMKSGLDGMAEAVAMAFVGCLIRFSSNTAVRETYRRFAAGLREDVDSGKFTRPDEQKRAIGAAEEIEGFLNSTQPKTEKRQNPSELIF